MENSVDQLPFGRSPFVMERDPRVEFSFLQIHADAHDDDRRGDRLCQLVAGNGRITGLSAVFQAKAMSGRLKGG